MPELEIFFKESNWKRGIKLQTVLDQHQDKKWGKVKWKVKTQKEKI